VGTTEAGTSAAAAATLPWSSSARAFPTVAKRIRAKRVAILGARIAALAPLVSSAAAAASAASKRAMAVSSSWVVVSGAP